MTTSTKPWRVPIEASNKPADTQSKKAVPQELFDTAQSFQDLGLCDGILKAIAKQGFEQPTHIQSQLVPAAISGRDVMGQSRTGTGKTAAFGLPTIHQLQDQGPCSGLILVPTRELAIQVTHEIQELSRFTNVKVIAVYGGQPINVQKEKLSKGPQIVVGTPGRVMDLNSRGMLPYDGIKMAVLDEVDRMLDIGFREDIRRILGGMRQGHQTILVSATISDEIERLSRQYLKNPIRLALTEAKSLTVAQVQQRYISVERWDKNQLLLYLLRHEEPALTLVFCRTKQTVDSLVEYLKRKNIESYALHANLNQGHRNRVMTKLRAGELKVLIASDLAARGLDVGGITHVINYDLPEDTEVYVHRIGRTARIDREGCAWSFVTPEQGDLLTSIEKLINLEIPALSCDGFKPGPIPDRIRQAKEAQDSARAESREQSNRASTALPSSKDAKDVSAFPGGIVPSSLPKRRMGGKLRRGRR
ncbi:MAG: DEAD/DEAH box helicase [Phycisphaerales bacterium]|nr:DEAD/DEAH box helicase [Phycisphaerales bacterium]